MDVNAERTQTRPEDFEKKIKALNDFKERHAHSPQDIFENFTKEEQWAEAEEFA